MSEPKKKKSWKTSACGIAGGVAILATQIVAFTDNDPETVIAWEAIITALGMLGLGWFARDNKVSSEDVK